MSPILDPEDDSRPARQRTQIVHDEYVTHSHEESVDRVEAPSVPTEVALRRLQNLRDTSLFVGRSLTARGRLQRMLDSVVGLAIVGGAVLVLAGSPDTLTAGDAASVRWLQRRLGGSTYSQQDLLDVGYLVVPLATDLQTVAELHVLGASESPLGPLDIELLEAIAAITAIGVENAGQYASVGQDHSWLDAAADITSTLLSTFHDEKEVWDQVVTSAVRLSVARTATLCLPDPDDPDQMRVVVAAGVGADALTGAVYPIKGSLAEQVMATGRGQLVDPDAFYCVHSQVEPDSKLAQTMGVPLRSPKGVRGAMVLSRGPGQEPFAVSEVRLAEEFANQAVLALELAELRAVEQRVQTTDDRERIAADLHDHVVQQLFATGLRLQSSARATTDHLLQTRLMLCVDAIDETMKQIRSSIFDLKFVPDPQASFRAGAVALVAELEPALGLLPRLTFHGEVEDLQHFPELVHDIRAVLREGLTNVAKHASATHVGVDVTHLSAPGRVTVLVVDDGIGVGTASRSSGRGNMAQRAARWGGNLAMTSRDDGGTELTWSAPIPATDR